jgi:6-pyruvoyltetrahydropterin/6-carboxytetrahydropterin synthase
MRVLPAVSCERIAQFVFDHTQPMIAASTRGRCWIVSVECFEHGANSAIYQNPETVLRQISAEALAAIVAQDSGAES